MLAASYATEHGLKVTALVEDFRRFPVDAEEPHEKAVWHRQFRCSLRAWRKMRWMKFRRTAPTPPTCKQSNNVNLFRP
jgi:hypothetical protein